MEDLTLRRAWSEVIVAADYELHMANVGQAQANAALVRDMVLASGLTAGSRILLAGCGPGQFFEFVSVDYLVPHTLVLADLNPSFAEVARSRAEAAGLTLVEAVADDIEATSLHGPFDLIVMVLVLEHVDWQKALGETIGLDPGLMLIVIQKNPEAMETMVTPHREMPGSLKECQSGEKPHLLEEEELVAHLSALGYPLSMRDERPVPDGKSMTGLMFIAS